MSESPLTPYARNIEARLDQCLDNFKVIMDLYNALNRRIKVLEEHGSSPEAKKEEL